MIVKHTMMLVGVLVLLAILTSQAIAVSMTVYYQCGDHAPQTPVIMQQQTLILHIDPYADGAFKYVTTDEQGRVTFNKEDFSDESELVRAHLFDLDEASFKVLLSSDCFSKVTSVKDGGEIVLIGSGCSKDCSFIASDISTPE